MGVCVGSVEVWSGGVHVWGVRVGLTISSNAVMDSSRKSVPILSSSITQLICSFMIP